METPQSNEQMKMILDAVGIDPQIREMVESWGLVEFRRGYLHGQREMKQRVENAVAGLRVETA